MSIEWSTWSWNPTIGCKPTSPGCAHCYAAEMAFRLRRMGNMEYEGLTEPGPQHALWTGIVKEMPQRLADPLKKKKPQVIFVNSMSDLFYPTVPFEFIAAVLGVVAATPQHQYIVLTKHIARALEFTRWLEDNGNMGHRHNINEAVRALVPGAADRAAYPTQRHGMVSDPGFPPANLWLGPSIENAAMADKRRAPTLELAKQGFNIVLSCEPLLEGIAGEVAGYWPGNIKGQPWVIAGGESGQNARGCDMRWLRGLRNLCEARGIAFYCKQMGLRPFYVSPVEPWPVRHERGADPSEWPEDLRVFQAPPAIAAILNAQRTPPRKVEALTPVVVASQDWEPPEQERSDA